MRDSAFFRRDIRDLRSKLGREAGIKITRGSGISCFHGVGETLALEFAPPLISRTLLLGDARQTKRKRALQN